MAGLDSMALLPLVDSLLKTDDHSDEASLAVEDETCYEAGFSNSQDEDEGDETESGTESIPDSAERFMNNIEQRTRVQQIKGSLSVFDKSNPSFPIALQQAKDIDADRSTQTVGAPTFDSTRRQKASPKEKDQKSRTAAPKAAPSTKGKAKQNTASKINLKALRKAWGVRNDDTYKTNTKGRIIKAPRLPHAGETPYTTEHYDRWTKKKGNVGVPTTDPYKGSFKIFDNYSLVQCCTVVDKEDFRSACDDGTIPKGDGVRLDDHLVGLAALAYSKAARFKYFPAGFDGNGMIRASRIPLGNASKTWRDVGDVDADGVVLEDGQEGFYYNCYSGIHPLMGKEGYDHGLYLVRPSFEDEVDAGTLSFKIGFKAVVQLAVGDPKDPTPGLQ